MMETDAEEQLVAEQKLGSDFEKPIQYAVEVQESGAIPHQPNDLLSVQPDQVQTTGAVLTESFDPSVTDEVPYSPQYTDLDGTDGGQIYEELTAPDPLSFPQPSYIPVTPVSSQSPDFENVNYADNQVAPVYSQAYIGSTQILETGVEKIYLNFREAAQLLSPEAVSPSPGGNHSYEFAQPMIRPKRPASGTIAQKLSPIQPKKSKTYTNDQMRNMSYEEIERLSKDTSLAESERKRFKNNLACRKSRMKKKTVFNEKQNAVEILSGVVKNERARAEKAEKDAKRLRSMLEYILTCGDLSPLMKKKVQNMLR